MQLDLQAALERGLAGRYSAIREIGRGGMAIVYAGRATHSNQAVAIKLLYPDLARAVGGERFLREIAILSRLAHPNILPLLDSGTIELLAGVDLPWYAMPLSQGETLRARLAREGQLPVETALGYVRDLCGALGHAHEQGYVHRDLKPENILIEDGRAILADFGVARALTNAVGDGLSSTGIVVGTPSYMSPEQSTGSVLVDGRSDLYALGVVLYEMLAGQPPFTGSTPQAISARHQFESPPPIDVVRPGLSPAIPDLLQRLLAKVPADRIQTAAEVAARCAELPAPRPRRSRWAPVMWTASVAALLAIAGLVQVRERRTESRSPLLAVLPFTTSNIAGTTVCGTECGTLVDDALGQWPDLPRVDELRVRNAVGTMGQPVLLEEAEAIARSVGAGRFIWGEVFPVGDSLRVRARLYQLLGTGSRTERDRAATLPLRTGGLSDVALARIVASEFRRLARELIAPDDSTALPIEESLEAASYGALRRKLSGDSAMAQWDLEGARQLYRDAIALDPAYPQANLALARIAMLSGDDFADWREPALRAEAGRNRLTVRQQRLAVALDHFADRRFVDACTSFRAMVQQDSSDFTGWFGLGECLARDDAVVVDPSSPSGLAFRGSYQEAMEAYNRALRLAPMAHVSYAGPAISRLLERYFAETSGYRRAWRVVNGDTLHYAAAPSIRNDTIAFIPRPADSLMAGRWSDERNSAANALGRQQLRAITARWIVAFPASASTWRAHAIALELTGALGEGSTPDASAIESIRHARGLPSGSHEALDLALTQVRILTKLGRFRPAALLADSVLSRTVAATPEESTWLAGLAALVGRVDLAATLLGATGSRTAFPAPTGREIMVPAALSREGQRLLVYAAFGAPADSLTRIARRLEALVERTDATVREGVRMSLFDRPTVLAFPLLGAPSGPGSIRGTEQALFAKDLPRARQQLALLTTRKAGQRPGDFSIDITLLEARMRLLAADSAGARRLVGTALQNLDSFGRDLVTEVPQAAAVGRMMLLAHDLGLTAPAGTWDSSAKELWYRP